LVPESTALEGVDVDVDLAMRRSRADEARRVGGGTDGARGTTDTDCLLEVVESDDAVRESVGGVPLTDPGVSNQSIE
jgi:hypothetical protein